MYCGASALYCTVLDGQVKTSQSFACSWCLAPLVEMWAYLKMKNEEEICFLFTMFFPHLLFVWLFCFFKWCWLAVTFYAVPLHFGMYITCLPLKTSLHFSFSVKSLCHCIYHKPMWENRKKKYIVYKSNMDDKGKV